VLPSYNHFLLCYLRVLLFNSWFRVADSPRRGEFPTGQKKQLSLLGSGCINMRSLFAAIGADSPERSHEVPPVDNARVRQRQNAGAFCALGVRGGSGRLAPFARRLVQNARLLSLLDWEPLSRRILQPLAATRLASRSAIRAQTNCNRLTASSAKKRLRLALRGCQPEPPVTRG